MPKTIQAIDDQKPMSPIYPGKIGTMQFKTMNPQNKVEMIAMPIPPLSL